MMNFFTNIVLTSPQWQESALDFTHQYGGVVAASCPVYVSQNGNFFTVNSDTVLNEITGLKIINYHNNYLSYFNSDMEGTFSKLGIMVEFNVFLIPSANNTCCTLSDEYSILCSYAESINKKSGHNSYLAYNGMMRFYPKV